MMKHKIILYAMIVTFLCAMPISAAACVVPPDYMNPYSGAWQPTGDSAFLVETDSIIRECKSLLIFDFNAPDSQLFLFSDGIFANATVYFTNVDSNWYADTTPDGQALAFDTAPVFGFLFDKCGTSWLEYDLSGTDGVASLLFERNTGLEVVVNGMEAVPIPPAVLLLGSGLIGIVALRRRK